MIEEKRDVMKDDFYYVRSNKLKWKARFQDCVMCGINNDTTVLAHSNLLEHGKAMSQKSSDLMAMWLCFSCHSELDQGNKMSKSEKRDFTLTAICRTINELAKQGIIKIGD